MKRLTRKAGTIFAKEIQETLRDRRTLFVMMLPLVFYPIVTIGLLEWVHGQDARQKAQPSAVMISAEPKARAKLRRVLSKSEDIVVVVRAAGVRVEVDEDFSERVDSGRTGEVRIFYDKTSDAAVLGFARVRDLLEEESESLLKERLSDRGLDAELVVPLAVVEKTTSTREAEVGDHVGRMLPIFALLMVMLGAFYPAIDLTAGERERGTLETLLVAPVSRLDIVVGKFLAVSAVASIVGFVNCMALGMTFLLVLREPGVDAERFIIPWSQLLGIVPVLIPTALFFSAVMMTVASLARTFKDAQNLMTPVFLLLTMPAMLAMAPGFELSVGAAFIPGVNIVLLVRDVARGTAGLSLALLTCLVTLAYAAITLTFAERLYRGERLMFGDQVDAELRSGLRSQARPSEGLAVLAVVLGLLIFVGQAIQSRVFVWGMLVTEWILVLGPCLLLARYGKLDRRAFGIEPAPAASWIGAALCGLTGWVIAAALVLRFQEPILPMPQELLEMMRDMLHPVPPRPLPIELFVLALSPAICEEVLFRGLLLRATRPTLGPTFAVMLNGLLFGLFHLSFYRFMPTAVLGVFLAILTLRAGSILPAMLFHFLNNGLTLVLLRIEGSTVGGDEPPSWVLTFAAAVAVALGLWLSGRGKFGANPPEKHPDSP